ncbi:MAG: TonB-dependent receptor [Bacteroidales bacterium]|nr:TonB-dependent receptor [Bacteroidales bacterium]MBN2756317.1 TonB-dependent receptor [Bacteroidales bacterium]
MGKFIILFVLTIFFVNTSISQNYITLSGFIKDASTGEELIGATIYVDELKTGSVTNAYGFYSISLSPNKYNIKISYIGYQAQTLELNLTKTFRKNFELISQDNEIEEIKISANKKDENVSSLDMSVNKLQMKTIMKIPALMGEVDVLRTIQMLPGVQTVGEGSIGFYVRGGGADENLILLDEATVYNASHLGGLFSVFNQDVLKDVKLYKGGIPSVYGGRLSSILEIRMKEGNNKKFSAQGGIGLISSRLTIETPIIKDKAAFVFSGRRTYADLFFPLLGDSVIKKSKAFFYDFNAKANYEINENNRIFVSGYFGKDVIQFGESMRMSYGNETFTLRYNHLFSSKLFANVSLIYSKFNYGMGIPDGVTGFDWQSGIYDISLKNDYTLFLNTKNTIKFGLQITHHTFRPGEAKPIGEESIFSGIKTDDSFAAEYGLFIENDQKINDKISLRYGLRLSAFQNIGPYTNYIYDKSNSKEYIPIDSLNYRNNDFFNTFYGIEPRFSLNFQINDKSSMKLSYNRMVQYIHLTTNTMTITPLDMWFPSSPNVKPQLADQYALGYFRNFLKNSLEASVEVYYKNMQNAIDFKDHAQLLLNKYFEGELRVGNSYSYGAEFMIKKQAGKFTGWLSYTYSRVFREIPEINDGNPYPANYDKPNDISLILSYDIIDNLNISLSWFYSTGAPRTMPTGRFEYEGMISPVYSDRNSVRLPDYHRMDFACTYDFKKTKRNGEAKKFNSSLNLSIYNLYNRHNAYSITFRQVEGQQYDTEAVKTYLFKLFPSLTYNFNF